MKNRPFKSAISLGFVTLLFYLVGYWILMVRDLPSVGHNEQLEFRSSSRFGEGVYVNHGITVLHGRTSILNYIFYPADLVFYAIKDPLKRQNP